MKAVDVMTRDVVTVKPDDQVSDAVRLLGEHDVSALPVVDETGSVVGMISEADLLHREEIGTDVRQSWWMEAITPAATLAEQFAKSHGRRVEEVMSRNVISASEEASLGEIAALLERHRIKRVPILRDGRLVGIVSRSNLVQALASSQHHGNSVTDSDRAIRLELLARLAGKPWTDFGSRNVIVTDGIVHLWGLVGSKERLALLAVAEGVPGVVGVSDEMITIE